MTKKDLLENVLLPIANPEDAESSCRALQQYIEHEKITAIHVIEKAGGAPDKAPLEKREQDAKKTFETVHQYFPNAETKTIYHTNVPQAIFNQANKINATAIVFTPREGHRWKRLLTGDVALNIITNAERPVLVLPEKPNTD